MAGPTALRVTAIVIIAGNSAASQIVKHKDRFAAVFMFMSTFIGSIRNFACSDANLCTNAVSMSLLIAESGSTKTEWRLLRKSKKPLNFITPGINPYLQDEKGILAMLESELPAKLFKNTPEAIIYYGAGAARADKQKVLKSVLGEHFGTKSIEVHSDILAAARGLCGGNKGIVCILGTGSASCYYDGKKVAEHQHSLGFIAGDEGSGNHMGKKVLQYYAYGTFDQQLKTDFEMRFGNDVAQVVNKLYHEPYPNRYLAGFVPLLAENRGHYMVENIIEDSLNDFFQSNILKYRQSWKKPLYFTGSVAHAFSDVIFSLCEQYELEPGKIEKSPMDGLMKFHKL